MAKALEKSGSEFFWGVPGKSVKMRSFPHLQVWRAERTVEECRGIKEVRRASVVRGCMP